MKLENNLDSQCIRQRRHVSPNSNETCGGSIVAKRTSPSANMQMTIISFEKGEKKIIRIDDEDTEEIDLMIKEKRQEDSDEQVPTVCKIPQTESCVPSAVVSTTDITPSITKSKSDETDPEIPETTPLPAHHSATVEKVEKFVRHVWEEGWNVISFNHLPVWLKDNDFLKHYHRPPLASFRRCFKSIFRVHTETGNIWTHLIGFVAFVILTGIFLVHPSEYTWQEKAVFMAFFTGAILCLGLSWVFHTVYCHSYKVSKMFSKLDYSGISFLIVGSFIPWLYYSFYCEHVARYAYIALISIFGLIAITVSLWDKFSTPKFRPLRAGVFIAMGLSAVIPAIHFLIRVGFVQSFEIGAIGWMVLMGAMYITGAVLYAVRVPERFFPGKCDIVFQSHQIFHVLVVGAAFVHYHGISNMAGYRFAMGECIDEE